MPNVPTVPDVKELPCPEPQKPTTSLKAEPQERRLSLLPPVPSHFYDDDSPEGGSDHDDEGAGHSSELPTPPPLPKLDMVDILHPDNEELNQLIQDMDQLQFEIDDQLR